MNMKTYIKKYTTRPAVNQDLKFCLNLHHKAFKVYVSAIWGWDEEKQNTMFNDGFTVDAIKIITIAQKDIGYYQLEEDDKHVIVCDLIIDQNYQGIGIGSSILKEIIEASIVKNQVIKLGVFKMNQRAMKLYRRLGFKVVEESETHYMMKYEPQKGQER